MPYCDGIRIIEKGADDNDDAHNDDEDLDDDDGGVDDDNEEWNSASMQIKR